MASDSVLFVIEASDDSVISVLQEALQNIDGHPGVRSHQYGVRQRNFGDAMLEVEAFVAVKIAEAEAK